MLAGLVALAIANGSPARVTEVDFARASHVDDWLRHPVYGDPSFDSFVRMPGNPIFRGSPEFAWPVNAFLFLDPKSPNWYAYIGDYKLGYGGGKSRCVLLRSSDRGKTWQNLGPVVEGDAKSFDKDGHTPDVSVVYDAGRYHMVYDWALPELNADGGLAYAWADRPEGPWHRAAAPITRNSTLTKIDGKYQRTYAPMLFRRRHDWLLLAMMDSAPQSWVLFAMTAKHPEGPYSSRRIVRQVERDYFHPPLMEGYPGFAHEGSVYVPMTSVARNRNFIGLFRAPLEHAEDPAAWSPYRNGSLWHAEDVESERAGLWGQTFSGQVSEDGRLLALFTSRDPQNFGTVGMAERPWSQPFRTSGFHFSGHEGPSFTVLNRSYRSFICRAELRVRGTARLIWDYHGALGPDRATSDATLHPLTMTRYTAFELSDGAWKVVSVDAVGQDRVLGQGILKRRTPKVVIGRDAAGKTFAKVDGLAVWSGQTGGGEGPIGLWVAPNTHVDVTRFAVSGSGRPAHLNYLYTEGLLGAGEVEADWTVDHGPGYRFGVGAEHKGPGGRAKWNFTGTAVILWSPVGPGLGKVRVSVDGDPGRIVDLRRGSPGGPAAVYQRPGLSLGPHCIVVRGIEGTMPIDGVEVTAGKE